MTAGPAGGAAPWRPIRAAARILPLLLLATLLLGSLRPAPDGGNTRQGGKGAGGTTLLGFRAFADGFHRAARDLAAQTLASEESGATGQDLAAPGGAGGDPFFGHRSGPALAQPGLPGRAAPAAGGGLPAGVRSHHPAALRGGDPRAPPLPTV